MLYVTLPMILEYKLCFEGQKQEVARLDMTWEDLAIDHLSFSGYIQELNVLNLVQRSIDNCIRQQALTDFTALAIIRMLLEEFLKDIPIEYPGKRLKYQWLARKPQGSKICLTRWHLNCLKNEIAIYVVRPVYFNSTPMGYSCARRGKSS